MLEQKKCWQVSLGGVWVIITALGLASPAAVTA